jgi:[glutamine synthetase] adenylyltransferase / [glutamine synthetase]-adenylyl-L-tyrosine phosphorylase
VSAPGSRWRALLEERRAQKLDDDTLRAELAGAGFADPRAAADAAQQLLAAEPADLPVHELLAGAAGSADPLRAVINAARLVALAERPACTVGAAELAVFLGASQHMADLLLTRPELIAQLGRPFDERGAAARYREAGAAPDKERALRRAQQADLLAIAWSDLVGGLDVEQVTARLSALADAAVGGAAASLQCERHFAIVALGKLGGRELNYSSDIDLYFVRPDGATDQPTSDRVARELVKLVGAQTPDGHLYRVDMRLRPEGSAGQLTRTLSSCAEYYRSVGRPWERQMLTKARVMCEADGAGAGLLAFTRAWILSCGLDAGAIRQFKRLKTASEAKHGGESGDVKQAPGGIRDIETIVQFLSLLHCGKQPALVTPSTLLSLERLRVAGAISTLEASRLRAAYRFHRRVENLLQVMHRVQTHALPADHVPIARLMGRRDAAAFDAELAEHRRHVRAAFERHFAGAFGNLEGTAAAVSELVLAGLPDGEAAQRTLAEAGSARPEASLAVLRRAAAPVSRFLPATPRLASAFASVAPKLLERLALAPDPDAALDRFERMTRGVGARDVLYEQLDGEPRLLAVLCDLAAGSPYLSDLLAGEPQIFDDVVDALLTGLRGQQRRRELLAGLERPGLDPWLLLSDHKKLETLRIGLLDLQDAVPIRQTLAELSQLCLDVLRRALDAVLARAVREHGEPTCIRGVSGRASTGLCVLALGKVGGLEANYASDADLMFVYGADGETERGTPNSVFFAKVAEEFMARVQGQRGGPRLYRIDTRLRPEGAKGPLVTSLRAFEAYYRGQRAALFERQALLKARVAAGDAELGQRLLQLVRTVVRGLQTDAGGGPVSDLAGRLREMRGRIEAQAGAHDLKRGTGGMVDVEFLVQYLQLRHGGSRPQLLVPETPHALELLGDAGVLPPAEATWLRDTYLFFRRVETRLQVALGLDTKEVPKDPEAARQLALRLGYADTAEGDAGHLLLVDLERAASETRARYEQWMK